jgi:septum formation protein
LASQSPQRRAILERLGVAFSVQPARVAELERGDPEQVVRENALRKARAVWPQASADGVRAVLGCDTIVALDGEIYGKPAGREQARRTLQALSGATHEVFSGLAMLIAGTSGASDAEVDDPAVQRGRERYVQSVRTRSAAPVRERVAVARTAVTFRALDGTLLDWYLAGGEWRDRAGAYAIQGAGAALVRAVAGDYENVVGLPVATLLDIYPELLESAP